MKLQVLSDVKPPKFLYIKINRRCNLKCQHCVFWKLDDNDKPNYISWDMKCTIMKEFSELNPQGTVIICGGEPMLDLEDYFSITRECLRLGLKCFSVINGTRIKDSSIADRMVMEGPSEITISLNSHIEEIHDRTRGVKGSFRMAVNALRLLIESRKYFPGCKTKIYAMTVLCEQTSEDLDGFYDFVLNDVKADKLKLNILQPTFGDLRGADDEFFAENQVKKPDVLIEAIIQCDKKYGLSINPEWLHQVKMYFDSININRNPADGWRAKSGTTEHICNTYERNIMLDLYGNAKLCFSIGFPAMQIKKYGDLRNFWYKFAQPIRQDMMKCNKYCGISHSVRREPATIHSS